MTVAIMQATVKTTTRMAAPRWLGLLLGVGLLIAAQPAAAGSLAVPLPGHKPAAAAAPRLTGLADLSRALIDTYAPLPAVLGLAPAAEPEAAALLAYGLPPLPPRKPAAPQNEKSAAARDLPAQVKGDVAAGSPTRALKRLQNAAPSRERDQLQAQVARGYLQAGKVVQAFEVAREAAFRSGHLVPQAGWIGGLAAWRMGRYEDAAQLFESSATALKASPWQVSAGAYWASRAHMRAHNPQQVSFWLEKAAAHPRTFYGLIATRALGRDFNFNWNSPSLSKDQKAMLLADPSIRAALLAAEQGERRRAEKDLRRLSKNANPALKHALMTYAEQAQMPGLAMTLAETIGFADGRTMDAALYPISPWKPLGGYKIDRALMHAIIRQESRFNPAAESHRGARGLMQLMPATARDTARADAPALHDPAVNLEIGQKYIEKLLMQDHVEAELFSLVVAYNAGPGNLRRWKKELADVADDPLLFIESLPMAETRAYTERVMANYWIYRLRLRQPVPSLDAVIEGQWAQYAPLDGVKQAGIPAPAAFRLAELDLFR